MADVIAAVDAAKMQAQEEADTVMQAKGAAAVTDVEKEVPTNMHAQKHMQKQKHMQAHKHMQAQKHVQAQKHEQVQKHVQVQKQAAARPKGGAKLSAKERPAPDACVGEFFPSHLCT